MLLAAEFTANFGAGLMNRAALFLSFVMVTMSVAPAWAYIDPNAGGLIFQIALPILSLGLAGIALLRNRIFSLIRKVLVRDTSVKSDLNNAED